MHDAASNMSRENTVVSFRQEEASPPRATPAPAPTVLQRCFPWFASVMIVSGIAMVAYQMDADTAAARLSGVPYLLLAVLYAALLAANRYIYRDRQA